MKNNQWQLRFEEMEKYLKFQLKMVESHPQDFSEGEVISLQNYIEHMEEIAESEY